MNIVQFFGHLLSEKIGQKAVACSGIVRLSIKDANKDPETITASELRDIFQNYLKARLQRIGFENYNEVTDYMTSQLMKNHAIFVMNA